MPAPTVDIVTATADPPPKGIPNPIHDDDGADGAGYAGALVAGVRTYGWAVRTITRAIGERWLRWGWIDYSLRRPLFVGERLQITVTADRPAGGGNADDGHRKVEAVAAGAGGDRLVLDGVAGLGDAPWLGELRPPAPRPSQDPPSVRPTYDLSSIPLGRPLRPLTVTVRPEAARRMVAEDLGIEDDRYARAARPPIHPFFLAGRMAPLTRHNFTYGPTIHVRSQIQHLEEVSSGQDITVGAVIVDGYERNEHWYQVLDGVITGSEQPGELTRIRHHTIFRPRGTELPAAG